MSTPGAAVALTILIFAAVLWALAANGMPSSCDPPRHVIVVPTVDGLGRHECVRTVTLPDGTTAIVEPTASPATPRR